MLTVGEFARLGGVSVRTLHHYDAIDLLPPATVDRSTGYRRYDVSQLARLNRIVALKDLGFALTDIDAMLDESIAVPELRGMLRLRRAELRASLEADRARLARVESRLQTIELESTDPTSITVRTLADVRAVRLTAPASTLDPKAVGPVLQPLFAELDRRLATSTAAPYGLRVAEYEVLEDVDHVLVHACVPIGAQAAPPDLEVVVLPAVLAASAGHEDPPERLSSTWQQLARWVDAHHHQACGRPREVYLDVSTTGEWHVELQQPLAEPVQDGVDRQAPQLPDQEEER